MNTPDIYIEALRRLVDQIPGGVKTIAQQTRLSAANLDQILTGVLHPSGRPRGVGPKLREVLSGKFPGWLTAPGPSDQETELFSIYRQLSPADQQTLLRMARAFPVAASAQSLTPTLSLASENKSRLPGAGDFLLDDFEAAPQKRKSNVGHKSGTVQKSGNS